MRGDARAACPVDPRDGHGRRDRVGPRQQGDWIRPGEKLNEVVVIEDESRHAVETDWGSSASPSTRLAHEGSRGHARAGRRLPLRGNTNEERLATEQLGSMISDFVVAH